MLECAKVQNLEEGQGMKTGQVAQALDVAQKTILNWVEHPALNKFFSASARLADGQLQREFTQDDLFALNTIRNLRAINTDWQLIAEQLDAGKRDSALPPAALTANTGITDMERLETSIITKARLDSALDRIEWYDRRLQQIERERDEWRERYIAETTRIREERAKEVARLQMELELRRSGRLKPDTE